jgi:hypothetical protein
METRRGHVSGIAFPPLPNDHPPVSEPARNYAKPFAIGGLIVGEIIMVLVMLAPNMKGGTPAPIDHLAVRLLVGSLFFGPFGMAAGTGVGLLVSGLLNKLRR